MTDAKFREFLTQAFKRMYEVADAGAPIYVFHADSEGHNFRQTFKAAGFKLAQCLIWIKNSLVLGRQDYQWRHEPILYGWKEGKAHLWYGDRDKDTVIEDGRVNLTKAKKEDLVQMVKDLQAKLHANTTTIYHDRPTVNAEHPTMKPIKLIGRILNNSAQRGVVVLDPFGGSGSTLMACEQSERIGYTMEMDPKYADVIVKRWETFTGLTATLDKGGKT
jgi:DNA modification methylase